MTHWSKKSWRIAGIIFGFLHNKSVTVRRDRPRDTGYPKYPVCVPADVPAGAPLLKVYYYGPLGARFFIHFIWPLTELGGHCTRAFVSRPNRGMPFGLNLYRSCRA